VANALAPPPLEYRLVSAAHGAGLAADVTAALSEGWRLHGSTFATVATDITCRVAFHQAMTRVPPPPYRESQ
jgi:hypothetical protein